MSQTTVSYKCQNCGSPLVIEPGQNQAMCPYCRSQNVLTVGADGQITVALVQKVDAIDNKTDQILAMTRAASMGHLLATTSSEHQHFIQNEYKPRMVALEEERDKIGKFNGNFGCAILAVTIPFCLMMAMAGFGMTAEQGDPGGLIVSFIFLAIAGGIFYAITTSATKSRNKIQEKMDTLTQKKAGFDTQISEIKKTMSSGQ